MALHASRWRTQTFPAPPEQGQFQEVPAETTIETGYHVDPGTGRETIVEQVKVIHSQFSGTIFHRTEEYWTYRRAGGPPRAYERLVYTTAWVPWINETRQLRLMEHEEVTYWAFSPLTSGDNLGKTRRLHCFVIWDEHIEEVTIDADAEERLNEQGMSAEGETTTKRIVHTQRTWREATNRAETIVGEGTRQGADWVENVEYAHDIVTEEADKWMVWTVKKNTLRPQAVDWEGPREVKKTGYRYELDVPIEPPSLTARDRDDGVELVARGGGAVVDTPNHPGGPHPVRVERYAFYRRTVSEPGADSGGDPNRLWATPPGVPVERTIIEDTSGGVSPSSSPTTEPHDPEPVDTSDEWSHVGEADNLEPPDEGGVGALTDTDVVQGGVYEYVAVVRIAGSESDLSNVARVTFTGTHGAGAFYRLSVRRDPETGDIEADALPTRDPAYMQRDFGDQRSFDVPAAVALDPLGSDEFCTAEDAWGNPNPSEPRGLPIPASYPGIGGYPPVEELRCPDWVSDVPVIEGARTAEELAATIVSRWYESARQPDYTVQVVVERPLLGLEQHQVIVTPDDIAWRSHGKDMDVESRAQPIEGRLREFKLGVEMNEQGVPTAFSTTLTLVVR